MSFRSRTSGNPSTKSYTYSYEVTLSINNSRLSSSSSNRRIAKSSSDPKNRSNDYIARPTNSIHNSREDYISRSHSLSHRKDRYDEEGARYKDEYITKPKFSQNEYISHTPRAHHESRKQRAIEYHQPPSSTLTPSLGFSASPMSRSVAFDIPVGKKRYNHGTERKSHCSQSLVFDSPPRNYHQQHEHHDTSTQRQHHHIPQSRWESRTHEIRDDEDYDSASYDIIYSEDDESDGDTILNPSSSSYQLTAPRQQQRHTPTHVHSEPKLIPPAPSPPTIGFTYPTSRVSAQRSTRADRDALAESDSDSDKENHQEQRHWDRGWGSSTGNRESNKHPTQRSSRSTTTTNNTNTRYPTSQPNIITHNTRRSSRYPSPTSEYTSNNSLKNYNIFNDFDDDEDDESIHEPRPRSRTRTRRSETKTKNHPYTGNNKYADTRYDEYDCGGEYDYCDDGFVRGDEGWWM